MQRHILTTTALIALTTAPVFAQSFSQQVINDFEGNGFTRVEITAGPTQLKAEGYRGGEKTEVIYSLETGEILSLETEATDDEDDDTEPGIEFYNEDEDFIDDEEDDEDEDDEDDDDD